MGGLNYFILVLLLSGRIDLYIGTKQISITTNATSFLLVCQYLIYILFL